MKAKAAKAEASEERDWMAEEDLRTLVNAEKIRADETRFKAAMKKCGEMKKALSAIKG